MLGKVRHSAAHRQCHGLMTVTELSGVGGPSRTASLTGPPKRQLLAGAPDLADCNDHPTWLRPCVPSPETRSFKLRHEIPPKPPVVNFPHSPTICGMSVEDSTSSYYLALFRRGLFLGGGVSSESIGRICCRFYDNPNTLVQNSHQVWCKHPCQASRTN